MIFAPWLHFHYRNFITTTGLSVLSALLFVLSPRGVSTCASPLTSERQVLKFRIIKPILSSCPLHADRRFVCYTSSHQSSSQTYARSLVLTVSLSISTPYQGFTCVHLLNTHLIPSRGTFSLIAHDKHS